MVYDPFQRGPHPVGVVTRIVHDAERDRRLPTEVWYPARASYRGRDLHAEHQDRFEVIPGFTAQAQHAVRDADPAEGRFPLVLFSHGFGSDRRQSSTSCTHWASHGYVVASPDHVGNTMMDMIQMALGGMLGGHGLAERMADVARLRPRDLIHLVEPLCADDKLGGHIEASRIGAAGHSFGGWTALVAAARDPRVAAVLGMAPVGGPGGPAIAEPLRTHLALDWSHRVHTLYLAAERDSLLPVHGMQSLLARTPSPRSLVVLNNTDHMHFCDRPRQVHELFRATPQLRPLITVDQMPRFSELCPEEPARSAVRALGLAHWDAAIKQRDEAGDFLERDAISALSRHAMEADRYG
jgi:predicted dienelactone hydrolase